MNEDEKNKKTVRSEIALIASVITIFAFLTGISSIAIFLPKSSSTRETVHTSIVSSSPALSPETQAPAVKTTATFSKPGPHDLVGQDGVASPTTGWLADYETKCVQGTTSGNAYLRWSPSKEGREYDRYVSEGEVVTVLAKENGYYLVKTNDGRAGWVSSKLLK